MPALNDSIKRILLSTFLGVILTYHSENKLKPENTEYEHSIIEGYSNNPYFRYNLTMTSLTEREENIKAQAIAFARSQKKIIARKLTDTSLYPPEDNPVAYLMSGSPGAGKTEFSKSLSAEISQNSLTIIRIDPDEIRHEFAEYNGTNSHLFHAAASIVVDCVFDLLVKNYQSFILDGTLSNYSKSFNNIKRLTNKKYLVTIIYVYQDPTVAWNFVRQREKVEGRRIMAHTFIEKYFFARKTVNKLKEAFGHVINIDLLLKDISTDEQTVKFDIESIDNHITEKYTPDSLNALIKEENNG